ncbi:hypothetical protein QR680_006976 [Steinernema hermaphroditum]|uniref:C2H2-type domain-containing protein n=1 Tax=Steinernema hermaphroditum TaxID=289476 RepID=A0AA39HZE0_9BILA|nr:hypothetical protein QR680_006976 [Steinernema hermaphroditum]
MTAASKRVAHKRKLISNEADELNKAKQPAPSKPDAQKPEKIEDDFFPALSDDDDEEIQKSATFGSPPTRKAQRSADRLAIWKCAVCGHQIKGPWENRQAHIESHMNLMVTCPVGSCLERYQFRCFSAHIKSHGITTKSLTSDQRHQVQCERHRMGEIALKHEMKYFPPHSFVGSSSTYGRGGAKPHCKQCGKQLIDLRQRRDHVGKHLDLKIACPMENCLYRAQTETMRKHLKYSHLTNQSELDFKQNGKLDDEKEAFHKKVDAVMEYPCLSSRSIDYPTGTYLNPYDGYEG